MAEADIQALLDGIAADLSTGVGLTDSEDRVLAHTAHCGEIDEVRRAGIINKRTSPEVFSWFEQWGIRQSKGPVRTPADHRRGIMPRWCVPVRFRGALMGYLWVLDPRGIAEDELGSAIETAAQIGVLLYRRRLLYRLDSNLLQLLLVPNPDSEDILIEARALGTYTHDGPVAVIVAGLAGEQDSIETDLSDLLEVLQHAAEARPTTTLSGLIGDLGVVLAPLRRLDEREAAHQLAERLHRLAQHINQDLKLTVAVGGATQLEYAHRSYAEARRTLRLIRAVPHLGPIGAWDNLGVFRALALVHLEGTHNDVIDARVKGLLSDPVLSQTAECFLDLAGDVKETAALLFIHRTTLYQRLDRIMSLYQLDLRRSGDHRLITHLGVKLAEFASN